MAVANGASSVSPTNDDHPCALTSVGDVSAPAYDRVLARVRRRVHGNLLKLLRLLPAHRRRDGSAAYSPAAIAGAGDDRDNASPAIATKNTSAPDSQSSDATITTTRI